MAVIQLGERPPTPDNSNSLAPFALGFRPFFILAGLGAVLILGTWLGIWTGHIPAPEYYGLIGWHSHEMLFGYTTAVIAGFLLTAVRNWTGIDTLTGKPLAVLALVWLAGRLTPFIPALPDPVIAISDLMFLPLFALALYGPLMRAQNKINRVFLPMISVMALANLLVHAQSLQLFDTAIQGNDLMLNSVLLLLILVSGRVLPFFTEKAVTGSQPRFNRNRERLAFGAIILWTLTELLFPNPWLLGILALTVAFSQLWRLIDWYHPGIWQVPILWVLFTGLAWFALGFLLNSLASLELFPANLATHALTTGAVGILTLGMMSRVALGHTGRSLQPPRLVELSFIAINLAVALRVFAPYVAPNQYGLWIQLSGGLWVLCFLLFSLFYLPVLLKPRIDGRPG
ncbi:MAG: NnrS family protein [gamma proteobacterium endosymbiont of Lamellibrachia anaximandri]|nr:NnrS family protein [gamma proteobacterium endosymbiont of Lamellibrachia anaximandri]